MQSIQERISKYIEYKGVTPYKFCKNLKFSMGYLDKRGAIGTDKYLKIIEYYPDLNPEWLLTGNGEMLKENAEPKSIRQSVKGDNNTQVGSGTATIHKANNEELDYLKEELKEYKKLLLEKDKQIALKDANISKMQDQIISLLNK